MDDASARDVDVLQWWRTSARDVDVLQWWRTSALPLKLSNPAIRAVEKGRVEALEWWIESGLNVEIAHMSVLRCASERGHQHILDVWKSNGLPMPKDCSRAGMDHASRPEFLEWWKNTGLKLTYSTLVLDFAIQQSNIPVLEWWKARGLRLKYDECKIVQKIRSNGSEMRGAAGVAEGKRASCATFALCGERELSLGCRLDGEINVLFQISMRRANGAIHLRHAGSHAHGKS
ncbi:hypothetical protein BJ742DRAFT_822529 [Cladochytrium replicatum]|nr:hypothetical protein BJ742DRAFT_822529 [Cladochytrium replicatum]